MKYLAFFFLWLLTSCGGSNTVENISPSVTILYNSVDQPITANEQVTLTAMAEDSDGKIVSYLWRQESGPTIDLPTSSTSNIEFIAPNVESNQTITISVTVKDNNGESAQAQISLMLLPAQMPPTVWFSNNEINLMANLESNIIAHMHDTDGEIKSVHWQQTAGAPLNYSVLANNSLEIGSQDIVSHSDATMEVTVVDNSGLSATAELKISIFGQYHSEILTGANDGKGVDLVLLAEGYQAEELAQFKVDAQHFANRFLIEPTIAQHAEAWNIHIISSISNQSGSSFPEDAISKDTVFESYFQCGGIARLLCIDQNKALDVAAQLVPQFDQVLVVVNENVYGGSGGNVAVYSTAESAELIAIHELGHSFAGLADEYSYGATDDIVVEPSEPNATTNQDIASLKWKHFLQNENNIPTDAGEPGVGLFEGAKYHAEHYFRPTDNSLMRSLEDSLEFGPVNSEAWAKNVYSTAMEIHQFLPIEETLTHQANTSLTFKVDSILLSNKLKVNWYINDELQAQTRQLHKFTVEQPPLSEYILKAVVTDQTGLIVKDTEGYSVYERTWSITEI